MSRKNERSLAGRLPPKMLRELLSEQPTPFYLYDEAGLEASCRAVREAFSWNEGLELFFPVRMNPNPAVLRVLAQAGCGALCASGTELLLAKKADAQKLLYAPCAFAEEDFSLSRALGAALILDGVHAMPPHAPKSLLLSFNPGGKLFYEGRSVLDMSRSKLGMQERELCSLCGFLKDQRPESFGLAIFLRDQEAGTEKFCAAAQALFSCAGEIYETFGLPVQTLLIVGGLGAQEDEKEEEAVLREASARVKESYERQFSPLGLRPSLQLAPGRILAARSGALLSRVLVRKEREEPLLILDMDCSQFLREIAFGASHAVLAPLAPAGREMERVRLAGALCDVRDHFAGSFVLPRLKPGEAVMICGAGADGHSFSSAYGGRGSCAEYLLGKDGSVLKIRNAQTPQELLAPYAGVLEHGEDQPEADQHAKADDRRDGKV